MKIFKRILGICKTPRLTDGWSFFERCVSIKRNKVKELMEKGSGVRLEGNGLPVRLLVVQDADGNFRAYENRCSHMGRRVDPLGKTTRLQCCSVSRSIFDSSGQPLSGAAKKPLKQFKVTVDDDTLVIYLDCPLA